jgi:hypothetical protein
MNKYLDKIRDVLNAPTDNFDELVRKSGLDPAKDFQFADLSDVDFGTSRLTGYNLRGANLTGAKLERAHLTDVNLNEVIWAAPVTEIGRSAVRESLPTMIFDDLVSSVLSSLQGPVSVLLVYFPVGGGKTTFSTCLFEAIAGLISAENEWSETKVKKNKEIDAKRVFLFRGTKARHDVDPIVALLAEITRSIVRLDFREAPSSRSKLEFFEELWSEERQSVGRKIEHYIEDSRDCVFICDDIIVKPTRELAQFASEGRKKIILILSKLDVQAPILGGKYMIDDLIIEMVEFCLSSERKQTILDAMLGVNHVKISTAARAQINTAMTKITDLRTLVLFVEAIIQSRKRAGKSQPA